MLVSSANPLTYERETVMALNIQSGEGIPANTAGRRASEPNPFADSFPTEEGKHLYVDLPSETDDEKAYVKKVKNQAHTAAREAISETAPSGYTARVQLTPVEVQRDGKGKKVPGTRLTIWTTDRVFREGAGRKPASTTTAPASE